MEFVKCERCGACKESPVNCVRCGKFMFTFKDHHSSYCEDLTAEDCYCKACQAIEPFIDWTLKEIVV